MRPASRLAATLLLALGGLAAPLAAQEGPQPPPGGARPAGPLPVHEEPTQPGIAWFGTWSEALAEAQRTNRPLLFMSAAPQCSRVPGVW
jgi:ABC-type sugar transport system substrate-binding protein